MYNWLFFSILGIGKEVFLSIECHRGPLVSFSVTLLSHSPEVKWVGHEFDLSRPSGSEGRNVLCYAVQSGVRLCQVHK